MELWTKKSRGNECEQLRKQERQKPVASVENCGCDRTMLAERLLYGHGLRQVPWLIYVTAAADSDVIRQ